MKVVYEEGEIKRLEKAHSELKNMGRALLFDEDEGWDPNRVYNLSFKVTNPGLAEYLLISLLNNKLSDFELGIDIVSLNFNAVQDKNELKRKLHEAIETLID